MNKVIIIEITNYAVAIGVTIIKTFCKAAPLEFLLMFTATIVFMAITQLERCRKNIYDDKKYVWSAIFCITIFAISAISLDISFLSGAIIWIKVIEIMVLIFQIGFFAWLCKLKLSKHIT